MKQDCRLEQVGSSDKRAAAASAREYGSNVMVLYHDPSAQAWAREVYERVKGLVGREAVHCTWWKISDLGSPGVLAGAVSTAMRADVIVVSVHAGEVLPLPFYVWVDSWLPHRHQPAGALMALIAMPEQPGGQFDRVREYLRVVARQAQMDFLIEERILPSEPEVAIHRAPRQRPAVHADRRDAGHARRTNDPAATRHATAWRSVNPRAPFLLTLAGFSSAR